MDTHETITGESPAPTLADGELCVSVIAKGGRWSALTHTPSTVDLRSGPITEDSAAYLQALALLAERLVDFGEDDEAG